MEMSFNEYQDYALLTSLNPTLIDPLLMWALGMGGESGEVLEQIKRVYRDDGGVITKDRLEKIKDELGDVLWYLSALARAANLSLQEIALRNLDKLEGRLSKNQIKGEGDGR